MPYLDGADATDRLDERFSITATITDGDAEIASTELDALAPFIGVRKVSGQENAFPRSVNPDGTTNTEADPPDAVLDWVALNAYRISEAGGTEGSPAVVSWSRSGVSETYASPALSQSERRMQGAFAQVQRWLLYRGRTNTSVTYYPRSFESYPNG